MIRLSGTNCLPPDQVAVGTELDPPGSVILTPEVDGSWSIVDTVGEGTDVGKVDLHADCVTNPRKIEVFSYPAVPVQVNTFRHLRVTPSTTVVAGTTLRVFSVGSCPSGGVFDVFAQLQLVQRPYHPSPTSYDVSTWSTSLGTAGGEWVTTLTVPSNSFPGKYELQAECGDYAPGFLAEYEALPITISAVGCRRPRHGRNSYQDRPCGPP